MHLLMEMEPAVSFIRFIFFNELQLIFNNIQVAKNGIYGLCTNSSQCLDTLNLICIAGVCSCPNTTYYWYSGSCGKINFDSN